jgi:hypothetical protein
VASTEQLTPDAPLVRGRTVRPVFAGVCLGIAVIVIAGLVFMRWQQAPIHGATEVFTRSTDQGVTITVERGDVRVDRIFCSAAADAPGPCTTREPGVLVRLGLPDGRSGGGTALPDTGYGPTTSRSKVAARVVLNGGLGIAPGSADEQFLLVRTDPAVRRVRAVRGDGTADEMVPVDGIAVLATTTGWSSGNRIEAFDDAGTRVTSD